MSAKVGAYGTTGKASDTGFRKEWSQEEYTAKAREKDRENHERAEEIEEYARKGKKPPRKKDDLPKPTELMKAREGPLELDKNLNKTIIVNSAGTGAAQPGFYCDICKRTNKDSVAYLDHINGRSHLRRLGQTTRVIKSTLNDVRMKIAELRAKTAETAEEKKYDFEKRIQDIKAMEVISRAEEKEAKKKKKVESKAVAAVGDAGPVDQDMMAAMGFGNFGSSSKS